MKKIRFTNLAEDLRLPVSEYCADIGIEISEGADIAVSLSEGDSLTVSGAKDDVKITYSRRCEIFRALSFLSDFIETGREVCEKGRYPLLSYMADCSRNAVLSIPFAKQMMRNLAGMGYNSMMLYTEDTYEIPEYPYFGYMRGRYSAEELRELDDYAYSFGLELIPCIQTLSHLGTALRWPDFDGYKESPDVLLIGDERTYKFVDAAIHRCSEIFRTRRINLGMDEAGTIGRGESLKRYGLRDPSEMMLEHLSRVNEICHKYGMKPMIWSDMFFRMAFDGSYRIREGRVPQEVIDKVPADVELAYWDYYSRDRALFSHMLDCHNDFPNKTVFAGGAWKWSGFGAHNAFSLESSKLQLDICEEYGINEVLVTGWGDNGGEASQVSTTATLLYFAERCYHGASDAEWLDRRAKDCFDTSFDDLLAFDLPDSLPECTVDKVKLPASACKTLLYNDPLERFMDRHLVRETAPSEYAKRAQRLFSLKDNARFGYAFETLGWLCSALSLKSTLGLCLRDAYKAGDKTELKRIAEEDFPKITEDLEKFLVSLRRQWYHENKTFGFIAQETRLGGLIERMRSIKAQLEAYVCGETERIEELEFDALPYSPDKVGNYHPHISWRQIMGAGQL